MPALVYDDKPQVVDSPDKMWSTFCFAPLPIGVGLRLLCQALSSKLRFLRGSLIILRLLSRPKQLGDVGDWTRARPYASLYES